MYLHIDPGRPSIPDVDPTRVDTRALQRARPHRLVVLVAAAMAVLSVTLMAAAFGAVVRAQDGPESSRTAEIRTGTCAAPGDVRALLVPLSIPAPVEGPTIAASVTDVTHLLEDLTSAPHVILVQDAASALGPICGPISGQPVGDHGLAVILSGAEGRIAGIAWLSELGVEATTVHVFVVSSQLEVDPSADASPSPSTLPSPTPSPAPTADGIAPGGVIDPGDDIDVDVDG